MGLFRRLFGGFSYGASGDPPESMPWDVGPSIYEHIRKHIVPGKTGLSPGGEVLPDTVRIESNSRFRWAPGALDGVMTHHMGTGASKQAVQKTVRLVVAYCKQPTAVNKSALYQWITTKDVVSVIDPVLESLFGQKSLNESRLYELARSFAVESPDREPVKIGIALLGLFRRQDDRNVFLTLGRHDEFTLFCAVALSNSLDAADLALWELAKSVDGWGRIHTVERLKMTLRPEIKDWLLRDGFRNSIMNEYLAYTCATTGGLLNAMNGTDVDRDLLTSAGEIIEALINGGPAQNIDDYDDGTEVLAKYLDHIDSRAESLHDFVVVASIKSFCEDESANWNARAERNWTEATRKALTIRCAEIMNRPYWQQRIADGLQSQDELEFDRANRTAKTLGIDTWEHHWRRLQESPLSQGRWYWASANCDRERFQTVVDFAERTLRLDKIATGPADELGLGPGFEPDSCLVYVLQELRAHPGLGTHLILTGLKSRSIGCRNMALNALAARNRDTWPRSIESALKVAAAAEPVDDVQKRMQSLLAGQPFSD